MPEVRSAMEVFAGSDGEVTKAYYVALSAKGPIGEIAVNLFRAQKCSSRAKAYRRGFRRSSFADNAYDRKNWSIEQLCEILKVHAGKLQIEWGWQQDPETPGFGWVLYIDLPQGQVSFHASLRGIGPDYQKKWDKSRLSAERILAFCDSIMLPKVESV